MKTLYIVRHAKSSWDHLGLADHERPLLPKGVNRTKLITDYLLERNTKIDLIITSHAVRALETAKIIANALHYPEDKIQISTDIYHSDFDSLLNHLFETPDDIESLMMAGHNPTFTYFANYFLKDKLDWLPTSGVVCVEFKTDRWEKVLDAKKRVKFVISPKMVKDQKTKNRR